MQKVEVKDAYINKYYLKGEATQYLGETQKLTPMVHLVNGSETLDLWVIDTVTYTSSDTTVASVTADGVVTAKKAGTTTITCKKGSTVLCTFSLTVSCNHNKVLQSTVQPTCQTTGENIYKCSKCGMTIKETIEKAKVEFKEAKEYLDKLIPLLSADKPAQKKMMDNAKTMLNFIDSQVK